MLQPFSHLLKKSKSKPTDSGPTSDGDEVDSGPTKDDEIENEPLEIDDDEDADDKDGDDADDEKEVAKARKAGFFKALKAVGRQAARRERMRGAAIFGSQHAAGRIELAANLAFSTQLSARDAIAQLSHSPRERIGNFDVSPAQSLMQATLRLVERMPGAPRTAMPPQFAEERARIHRIELAEERLKAAGGNHHKNGLGLLRAVAALPPPPRGF